ncbi:MAG: thioredoxin domain-containing protein [Acidimicrobiia bacterium]
MSNRLAGSASPYLLQHANNPVDWFEWGPEAFAEARRRDVPLLVSIGYSACHWCHVMAHESFEDPEIAAQMNQGFVNVKVDREERPDVDAVYMEATQAMTGQGGWPMTVFVDHSGAPFFTGTYYPPTERHGMPGFRSVLAAVSEAWSERRSDVTEQASRVAAVLGRRPASSPGLPGSEDLAGAVQSLSTQFDPDNGGFGRAPKFPQQPVLEFLLRTIGHPWADGADRMLKTTLEAMAAGGIRDHLGGGFARYAVDGRWLVPHFEKMLYDNAQLARLYLWAGVELSSPLLTEVAGDTLEYLLTDLRHPRGAFYSAEDADSEGVEGKFYLWDYDEFMEVTGPDGPLAADMFGVSPEGNFEGSNVLHRPHPISEVAQQHGLDIDQAAKALRRAVEALLARRARRVRPGLDDKIVTAWNGLAIRALAEAGATLGEDRYLTEARNCARFLLANLRDRSGLLRRSWAKGRPGPRAVLDDYASLAMGFFRLYAATGEGEWYEEAMGMTRSIPELFADPEGGFFSAPPEEDELVVRPRDLFDNPAPSGSSLAVEALLTAAAYTGDHTLRDLAEEAIRSTGEVIRRAPAGVGHMLAVLTTLLDRPPELAVVGPNAADLASVAWERYRPGLALAVSNEPRDAPPLLEGRGSPGRTLAYLCREFVCDAPLDDPDALRSRLA